jgi:hypothetical protein
MQHPDRPDQPNRRADAPVADEPPRAAVTGARSLTAHEAADFLHVSLATLRTWEQEFGFPASRESKPAARDYLISELLALQDALPEALSVSSAIRSARRQIAHAPLDPHRPLDTTACQLDAAAVEHGPAGYERDRA